MEGSSIQRITRTIEYSGKTENEMASGTSIGSRSAWDLVPSPAISSLYIHIPFCVKKCSYCDFFSIRYDESIANAYTDALRTEMRLKSRSAGTLTTIYIGGGTPTLLPERLLKKILTSLRDHFRISSEAEISVEANPGTLRESTVKLLVSLGVNRISLGVQSLVDEELSVLGRIHTAHDAVRAVTLIQKSGIPQYSIDLMYGIPGQTLKTWSKTLMTALHFMPNHVSAYELTFEEGTPITTTHEKPAEDLILDLYERTIEYLTSHGYEHYEISNFARAGFRCRHNMNYWDGGEYIGIGAGAHSYVGGIRSRNDDDIGDYLTRLNNHALPEREATIISREDYIREFLMLGLRKSDGINVREAQTRGVDIVNAAMSLCEEGYLEYCAGFVRLTKKGRVLANAVVVRLFECLGL